MKYGCDWGFDPPSVVGEPETGWSAIEFDELIAFRARDIRRTSVLVRRSVRSGVVHWTTRFDRTPLEQSALAWWQRRLDWSSNVRRRKRRKELERRRCQIDNSR